MALVKTSSKKLRVSCLHIALFIFTVGVGSVTSLGPHHWVLHAHVVGASHHGPHHTWRLAGGTHNGTHWGHYLQKSTEKVEYPILILLFYC